MDMRLVQSVIDSVYAGDPPRREDIEFLLRLRGDAEMELLFDFADQVKESFAGDGILLRGLVEFSNVCDGTCAYCGLNRANSQIERYRLNEDQIMDCVRDIYACGVKTVVLQSGQNGRMDANWLAGVIERIKATYDMAVTLSVGERSRDDYEIWKDAGADRYLLKIETTDPELYKKLHPGMSFENRMRCLEHLAELGYQTGTGNLIGLRGQSLRSLVDDILFFKNGDFDMLSVSAFIPHSSTELNAEPVGDLSMALKVLAVTRIVTRRAHMPASTAIGSLGGCDHTADALQAGANVVMPNFSPISFRRLYEIYPGKKGLTQSPIESIAAVEKIAISINGTLDYGRGDSLKLSTRQHAFASKQQCS